MEAPLDKLPKTRVIVLEEGNIVFNGSVEEFTQSELYRQLRNWGT